MNIKKYSLLGVISIALGINVVFAESYVAQDFDDPVTGKKTVFWGDSSKGKDAYVLKYDAAKDEFYFKKVEKNASAAKAASLAKNVPQEKALHDLLAGKETSEMVSASESVSMQNR